jgi:hypothetical protein
MSEGRRSEALLSWIKEIQIILCVAKQDQGIIQSYIRKHFLLSDPWVALIINVRGPEVRGIVKLSQGNSDYFACRKTG